MKVRSRAGDLPRNLSAYMRKTLCSSIIDVLKQTDSSFSLTKMDDFAKTVHLDTTALRLACRYQINYFTSESLILLLAQVCHKTGKAPKNFKRLMSAYADGESPELDKRGDILPISEIKAALVSRIVGKDPIAEGATPVFVGIDDLLRSYEKVIKNIGDPDSVITLITESK